jgi:hypothetical protein
MICGQNAHLCLITIKSNTFDLHDYNQVKIITLTMAYMIMFFSNIYMVIILSHQGIHIGFLNIYLHNNILQHVLGQI